MGTAILFVMGIVPLIHGIWLLSGHGKGLYFVKHSRAGAVYAEIPCGIGFLLLAISTLTNPEIAETYFLVEIAAGLIIIGVIFSFVRPFFLKPAWLKWLERNHGRIMPTLVKEAHTMGLEAWQERVKTQEELEAWVDEVQRKHMLEE